MSIPATAPPRAPTEPRVDTSPRATPPSWLAAGSVVTALAASSCCLLPLALFTLGVGGAWTGRLTRLAPYQPIFLGISGILLATGWWRMSRTARAACRDGSFCARPDASRLARAALWVAVILVILAVLFPYAVRPFLDG